MVTHMTHLWNLSENNHGSFGPHLLSPSPHINAKEKPSQTAPDSYSTARVRTTQNNIDANANARRARSTRPRPVTSSLGLGAMPPSPSGRYHCMSAVPAPEENEAESLISTIPDFWRHSTTERGDLDTQFMSPWPRITSKLEGGEVVHGDRPSGQTPPDGWDLDAEAIVHKSVDGQALDSPNGLVKTSQASVKRDARVPKVIADIWNDEVFDPHLLPLLPLINSKIELNGIEGDGHPLGWLVPFVEQNPVYQDAENKLRNAVGTREVDALICLGMGSPSENTRARYKCACALALFKALCVEIERVLFYHPMMKEEDIRALCKRGWTPITSEFDFDCGTGDRVLLLFMPHNDTYTVERVLDYVRRNNALDRVVLFGDELPSRHDSHNGLLESWFIGLRGSPAVQTRPCLDFCRSNLEASFQHLAITTFEKRKYSQVATNPSRF